MFGRTGAIFHDLSAVKSFRFRVRLRVAGAAVDSNGDSVVEPSLTAGLGEKSCQIR